MQTLSLPYTVHERKRILFMLPFCFFFCMRSYIMYCTCSSSHVFYSSTQDGSGRHAIYRDPRKSGENGDQLRRRYENVSFVGNQQMNSRIPRWNRGLCIVICSSFPWHTYLVFFTLCPISVCVPYWLGRIREGRSGAWMCAGVFTVQRSLVCMWWMR